VVITALHGFLGLPSDWDFLRDAGFDIETPSLDAIPNKGDVLLGYSMGGRLALHALLRGASYQRAVIVSAGLGVEGDRERAARRVADEAWARRFETEDWASLMRAWNEQPLFGAHELPRHERDFDRAALARALRDESPAVLPVVADRLHEITIPVLWIAGERDSTYVREGRRAAGLLPNAELWICPGAAHRVPWEQPARFIERLTPLR
jgi:2-succinyl-6-hydroxy-2,4-cyclohexadiene-1-carboxylate synthase